MHGTTIKKTEQVFENNNVKGEAENTKWNKKYPLFR